MAPHETIREVSCVNWHSSADNYWKWDQEIPDHCYRKCHHPFCSIRIIFIVVNCTASELPDIDTDRTDVHRVGWNNEVTYQTAVRYVSINFKSYYFEFSDPQPSVQDLWASFPKRGRLLLLNLHSHLRLGQEMEYQHNSSSLQM